MLLLISRSLPGILPGTALSRWHPPGPPAQRSPSKISSNAISAMTSALAPSPRSLLAFSQVGLLFLVTSSHERGCTALCTTTRQIWKEGAGVGPTRSEALGGRRFVGRTWLSRARWPSGAALRWRGGGAARRCPHVWRGRRQGGGKAPARGGTVRRKEGAGDGRHRAPKRRRRRGARPRAWCFLRFHRVVYLFSSWFPCFPM